ncbi:hypothetical protein [Cellulosilyticum sp. I15G10I2]|uniref:hypothetical protein n=1 Tax=Cellulosilyticum sp. I15G10I2 TaxID=1892843 RepID=UPI00085BD21B|nr:hypothetical protein [Cellulosilyticum sp. I15G10I2]
MTLEKIRGFLNLKKEHQQLFIRVHAAHQRAVGDKSAWQPTAVVAHKERLKVTFTNGQRLYYSPFCKWSGMEG